MTFGGRMDITPFIRLAAAIVLLATTVDGAVGASTPAREPAPSPGPAIAAAVAVTTEGPKTRFTVMLSKPVTARAHLMERPDRVVVDLGEVTFHVAGDTGRKREGLIASFRYGLFAPGRSRMVIDLAQPALVSRIDVEPDPRSGSARLVVELVRTDRDSFHRAAS